MSELKGDCGMGSIQASEERVRKAIAPYIKEVSIGALNGPESTVISGSKGAIRKILGQFESEGVKVKELVVSHGFHSPQMDPMLDEFEKIASEIKYTKPKLRLISNLTGKRVENDEVCSAVYWRKHVREAVRYGEGIKALLEDGYKHFLEIGPGTTLVGMGSAVGFELEGISWLPSLKKDKPDWGSNSRDAGNLYTQGAKIDWKGFDESYPKRRKLTLPTYPFQRQKYWVDVTGSQRSLKVAAHQLLGRRFRPATWES